MSGIAGIYQRVDGLPADAAVASRMLASLAHRGPDGLNLWQGGQVALGHSLFCTTPESVAERQPLTSLDGQMVLVADARLDDRQGLMAKLDLRETTMEPCPDSALILAAYQRWGQDCPRHLLGDFAMVVWDASRREL